MGDIKRSVVVSGGSIVTNSLITNSASEHSDALTPEMWGALAGSVFNSGSAESLKHLDQLRTLLEQGKRHEAKPIWQCIRNKMGSMLQHSANIAQIVSVLDALTR